MFARRGFTLPEVLVAIGIVLLLVAALIPSVQSAREAARRNGCVCHGKQIVLALHNHHDVFKRFPNSTSTRIRGVRPGCAGPVEDEVQAGYSWQVMVLPYLEETSLYNAISEASEDFKKPAFATDLILPASSRPDSSNHFAHTSTGFWRCPSFSGPRFSDAAEYVSVGGVETSTYVALSATDIDRILNTEDEVAANGCLIPPPQHVSLQEIVDGSSRTLISAETREKHYSSWYDGTVSWSVGSDPNGTPPIFDERHRIVASAQPALDVGSDDDASVAYLPVRRHKSIQQDWRWGPSSEHSGGVVMHGIADGSVRAITVDIDPTLYLQLITRSGREKVNLPD
jgi:prepilin-type N-terminal cleavage/methylation domain-containing protein